MKRFALRDTYFTLIGLITLFKSSNLDFTPFIVYYFGL